MTEIQTHRLRLRRFTWGDLDELAFISADPETRRYMWAGPLTRDQTADNIRRWIEEYEERGLGTLALVYKPDGRLIGQCGLGIESDELYSVGYMIYRDYWGLGLATEAGSALLEHVFETFGPNVIRAEAMADNAASRRVMEKLGMTHQITVSHEAADQVFYTIAREEFLERAAHKSTKREEMS